jgi:hypothetical protein
MGKTAVSCMHTCFWLMESLSGHEPVGEFSSNLVACPGSVWDVGEHELFCLWCPVAVDGSFDELC